MAWKVSRRMTPERKVAAPTPTKPLKLTPTPTKSLKLTPAPTKRIELPATPTEPLKLTPAPTEPHQLPPTPTKRIKFRKRIELPPRPVFPRPLSPEELRRKHLEEMLSLVQSWIGEQWNNCQRKENILDKARIRLASSQDFFAQLLPEAPMSAAQLRDYTRPPEMDGAIPQGTYRTEEVCAKWLANWLEAWAPEDKQLRKEVLEKVRALVTV